MNGPTKLLLSLFVLAAAGGAAYLLTSSPEVNVPPPVTPVKEPVQAQQQPDQPVVVQEPVKVEPQRQEPQRTVVDPRRNNENADAPQGVTGRVLLPSGVPAGGIAVYLMKSAAAEPIEIFLANKRGQVIPPAAAGTTAQDGTFRLGIAKAGDTFDLRVVSEQHPELQHARIKPAAGDWYDAGDLRLEQGAVVTGRVVEEGTNAVITGARVYLNETNQTHSMLATPGREKGIAVDTDAGGYFRFENAPRMASVNLMAEAQGYARAERNNLVVQADKANDFVLELARGMPISGMVVSSTGQPIRGAKVSARGLSAKVPQLGSTVTEQDGTFTFPSLREGPYELTATATQYEERVEKPVMSGASDVKLVLEQRGMVRIRVLSKKGTPVKSYTLSLKRWFPNNPMGIGNVPEYRDVRITPGDYEGEYATVRGLPSGEFVFQVITTDHAKTISPSFVVQAGAEPPVVDATLTLGGTITGRVVDDRGQPVAGAAVSTDFNGGFAMETEFGQLFRQFMPEKITKSSAKTDAQGNYKLPLLAFGDYMIRVAHPDFCEGAAMNVKLEQEGSVEVPQLTLLRGTIVEGVATVGGVPTGQVKVTIGPPTGAQPEMDAEGKPKMAFMANAVSAGDGTFRFTKRVPPGTYQIHASKAAGDNNPFVTLLQMKQTARPLTVLPGQEKILQNFDVPAQ